MSRTLQFKRYSNTALLSVTGAVGELIVDTTNDTITVHNGATAGGTRLATERFVGINPFSQAAFNQANTAYNLGNLATTINITQNTNITLAYAKANAANILAQAAFDKANTGGIANNITNNNYSLSVNSNGWVILPTPSVYSDAPGLNAVLSANSQLQLNAGLKHWQFDGYGQFKFPDGTIQTEAWVGQDVYARTKANSANVLAQAAFNTANTANARNIINGLGVSKLDLATYGANSAYLTTTNNDSTALFMGTVSADLYAYTNINIRSNTGGITQTWTFNETGTLTFPDSSVQNTAFTGTAIDRVARIVANSTAIVANIVAAGLVSTNTNTAIALAGVTAANANITLLFGLSTAQNTLSQTIFTAANNAAQTIPQNAQAVNYVLQSSDAGKHLYYTNSSAVNLYIPWTANTSWSNGTSITIISQTGSSANVTVLPNTGVSLFLAGNTTSNSRIVTTYGMATLIMVKANTWFINGTGVV